MAEVGDGVPEACCEREIDRVHAMRPVERDVSNAVVDPMQDAHTYRRSSTARTEPVGELKRSEARNNRWCGHHRDLARGQWLNHELALPCVVIDKADQYF
ncbi:MAG: hypothetical protein ACRDTS_19610 [Mycobacterium sp.]